MRGRLDYLAASPRGMQAFGSVALYIAKCGLPADLVNLVYLRVSQINGCSYCIATHAADLMRAGVSSHKLILLPVWRDAAGSFSDRERAALQWAEVLADVAERHPSDAEYEAARTQFDDKELTDLTYAIGLIGAYNRVAIGFGRGPDPTFATPDQELTP